MRNPGKDRHFWRLAFGVFALVSVLNYFPVLSGQVPFPRDHVLRHSAWDGYPRTTPPQQVGQLIDVVALFYPFRAWLSRSIGEGTLPLWNPHIMSGAPFEANAQSALFYPPHILYYLFPLKAAWTINLMLRLFLAAVFMALFVRSIGGSPGGAMLSGILFALCGFTIEWQGTSIDGAGIWLPLMFYAVHRLYRNPGARSIAIAAFAFAMPVLAGHPETAVHETFAVCLFAGWLWTRRIGRRFLQAFVLAGILAVGLAAVQWIPTIEWLREMPSQLENPQPVLDRHQGQGFFSRDIRSDPSSALVSIPEGASYVGMLGMLAASLSLYYEKKRYAVFLLIVAAFCTAVSFGIQPVGWIMAHIPVVKAIKNSRLILVVDFALAAMAGLGVSALEQRQHGRQALITLGAAFLVLSFCIYEVHRATMTPVSFDRSPWASLIFLFVGFLPLLLKMRGRLEDWRFPLIIVLIAGIEMVTYSYGYLGFSPAAEVFPTPPVVDFLRTAGDPGTFRVARDRVPMPHDSGMIFGFEEADGYEIATERASMFVSGLTEDRPDGVMFQGEKILLSADRRFDMLNVKYLIASTPNPNADLYARQAERFVPVYSQGPVTVFENKTALPRAFLVPTTGIEIVSDKKGQLDRIKQPRFDPLKTVVFEQPLHGMIFAENGLDPDARLAIIEQGANHYRIAAQSRSSSILVLSQTYYPGWKATVNGVVAPVYPVDLALTGVILGAGVSDVRLFFQPLSFRIGAEISLIALVATAVLATRRSRQ